mgnify:CR=1 FL=1
MSAASLLSTLNVSSRASFKLSFILCLHSFHSNVRLDSYPKAGKKKFDYLTTYKANFFAQISWCETPKFYRITDMMKKTNYILVNSKGVANPLRYV